MSPATSAIHWNVLVDESGAKIGIGRNVESQVFAGISPVPAGRQCNFGSSLKRSRHKCALGHLFKLFMLTSYAHKSYVLSGHIASSSALQSSCSAILAFRY